MSDNIVKFRTVQCTAIRKTLETLKEILTDTNISFDKSGLKIKAINGQEVALVYLTLHADKFEEYSCKEPISVGVNMMALFRMLKKIGNNDVLSMYITNENRNILHICIENGDKGKKIEYAYKLLDQDDEEIDIPKKEFNGTIKLPAADFQSDCRRLIDTGETVEIISVNKQLIMKCSGNTAKLTISYCENENGIKHDKDSDPDHIYQNKFLLKYLTTFTKATDLCTNITIYLANDFPLILEYDVGDLGELKFALTPKIDDNL